jgi:hypothetical protein
MFLLKKNSALIFFVLIILIGVFLRTYQLNFENYWLDEMISYWVADPNISHNEALIRREQLGATSPVLFDLILREYLTFFSYEPEYGRHVPLIFGALSIPFLGILSHQISKNNSYLLTIFLASINVYLISYSQEVRPYSFIFFLSIINLIFYYKIVSKNEKIFKKIIFFNLFVIFSVLTLSSHPFTFIILFSQIINSIYVFLFFKKKNYLFFLSVFFILLIYLLFNLDYIISQLSYNKYFLPHENWKFYYNYYFSRFFGSKIMGIIYLSILIYLIVTLRKKIFYTLNKYLLLIFILIFSYIIPLAYAYLKTPILTDRYIIYVLIPILILISSLIFEVKNKKVKIFIFIFLLGPTIINNFMEIKDRKINKPEFKKFLDSLEKNDVKNLTVNTSSAISKNASEIQAKLVRNYIKNLKEFKNNNFQIFNLNDLPKNKKMIWVICYEPLVGSDCSLPNEKKDTWILIETKQNHFLNSRLYEIN